MKVYQGPFPFALGDELDHCVDVVSDLVPLVVVIYLDVAVAEEQVVVDACLVSADGLDDVLVFKLFVCIDEFCDLRIGSRISQIVVPAKGTGFDIDATYRRRFSLGSHSACLKCILSCSSL